MVKEFETLEVWKRSACLSSQIYQEFKGFRDYGYKDQITRAGLSVSSNIAEGFERGSFKQFTYFLKIAKGSAGELRSQIHIGIKIGYIEREKGKIWIEETKVISKMLYSLIESINRKIT